MVTADGVNPKLADGLNVVLVPGIYNWSSPLQFTVANQGLCSLCGVSAPTWMRPMVSEVGRQLGRRAHCRQPGASWPASCHTASDGRSSWNIFFSSFVRKQTSFVTCGTSYSTDMSNWQAIAYNVTCAASGSFSELM